MKRVLVVINKWWECDPALAAMLNDNTRPKGAPWPPDLQPPRQQSDPNKLPRYNVTPLPRATFPYKTFSAEVWCISDLLEDLPPECQSSSSAKAERLPGLFSGAPPDLVIAVGTAGSCSRTPNWNGWVTVGTSVFMHDGHPADSCNPLSQWRGPFDQLIESYVDRALFSKIAQFDAASAIKHFLPVPLNPSQDPDISIGFGDVALGTLNVTDYRQYTELDPKTVNAFSGLNLPHRAVSLETTHGLIRMQCESAKIPFLFVSGITDRLGFFDTDDAPRADAQNTAAAHNAGVVVTWMLAALDIAYGAQPNAVPATRSPVTTCPGCKPCPS